MPMLAAPEARVLRRPRRPGPSSTAAPRLMPLYAEARARDAVGSGHNNRVRVLRRRGKL